MLLKLSGRWISCGMSSESSLFLPLKKELFAGIGLPQARPTFTSSWYSRLFGLGGELVQQDGVSFYKG